jgi:hypothetical protein
MPLNFYDIAPEQILAIKAGARTVKARFTGELQEFRISSFVPERFPQYSSLR